MRRFCKVSSSVLSFNTIMLFKRNYLANTSRFESLLYTQEYYKAGEVTLSLIPSMTAPQLVDTVNWINTVAFMKYPMFETRHVLQIEQRIEELVTRGGLDHNLIFELLAETKMIGCTTPLLNSAAYMSVKKLKGNLSVFNISHLMKSLSYLDWQVAREISDTCFDQLVGLNINKISIDEYVELFKAIGKADDYDFNAKGDKFKLNLINSLSIKARQMTANQLIELVKSQARNEEINKSCYNCIMEAIKAKMLSSPGDFFPSSILGLLNSMVITFHKKALFCPKDIMNTIGNTILKSLETNELTTEEAAMFVNKFEIFKILPAEQIVMTLVDFVLQNSKHNKDKLIVYASLWEAYEKKTKIFETVGVM